MSTDLQSSLRIQGMSFVRMSISFGEEWDGRGFAGGEERSRVVWLAFGLHWFHNRFERL